MSNVEITTHEVCLWRLWGKFHAFWNFSISLLGHRRQGRNHPQTLHLHWRHHQLQRDHLDLVGEKDGGCHLLSGSQGSVLRQRTLDRTLTPVGKKEVCVHPENKKMYYKKYFLQLSAFMSRGVFCQRSSLCGIPSLSYVEFHMAVNGFVQGPSTIKPALQQTE